MPSGCRRTVPGCASCSATSGRMLVVVDRSATIGALPATVARDIGVDVAHASKVAMRCIGDLQPGNAKTDARHASIIAEAVRSMPTRDVPRRRG